MKCRLDIVLLWLFFLLISNHNHDSPALVHGQQALDKDGNDDYQDMNDEQLEDNAVDLKYTEENETLHESRQVSECAGPTIHVAALVRCAGVCDGSVNRPFPNFQQALAFLGSRPEGTILVRNGQYTERNLQVLNKKLCFRAAPNQLNVVLTCRKGTKAFLVQRSALFLRGFKIQACGIQSQEGGAIAATSSFLNLVDMVISNNIALDGAAISIVGSIASRASLACTNCTFSTNVASRNGGALNAQVASVRLTRTVFSFNVDSITPQRPIGRVNNLFCALGEVTVDDVATANQLTNKVRCSQCTIRRGNTNIICPA